MIKTKMDGRTIFTLTGLVAVIILFIYYILIPWYKADLYFKELEYNGVIKGIEYREGNRGVPHILIDDTWRLLLVDEFKIESHISVGDSIVKKEGMSIDIYERINGRYQLKGSY